MRVASIHLKPRPELVEGCRQMNVLALVEHVESYGIAAFLFESNRRSD
jgi:hypothetical protein